MPKLRIGVIPKCRLSAARKVRDKLIQLIGDNGYAVVSIYQGGYSVLVRLYEGVALPDISNNVDNVHVKVGRIRAKKNS